MLAQHIVSSRRHSSACFETRQAGSLETQQRRDTRRRVGVPMLDHARHASQLLQSSLDTLETTLGSRRAQHLSAVSIKPSSSARSRCVAGLSGRRPLSMLSKRSPTSACDSRSDCADLPNRPSSALSSFELLVYVSAVCRRAAQGRRQWPWSSTNHSASGYAAGEAANPNPDPVPRLY